MRIIAHLDLDAFFASIEERDKPRLRGRPVVVGADPLGGRGRGVVSTANYAARKYGIHSAMPIMKAWELSEAARRRGEEPAAFLGVDMEKYAEESRRVMAIVRGRLADARREREAEPAIEVASVDEAFIDLSSTGSYGEARAMAQAVKDDIKSREGITASVGIGPNKLIAKIASDREKPDGLTVVRPEEAEKFLEPLAIRTIPGIGPKTEAAFARRGIRTVRDAKRFSEDELRELLGKWGAELYGKLRGRDDAPLVTEWIPKSMGSQTTFARDVPVLAAGDRKALTDALAALAAEVDERFGHEVSAGRISAFRAVTLTVRFSDFTTKTRSVTLEHPSTGKRVIAFQALRLFMPFLDRRENPGRKAIRLLGIRVEKLAQGTQKGD